MMNPMDMAMCATIAELDALELVAWPIPEDPRKRIAFLEKDIARAYRNGNKDGFMRLLEQWELEYKTNQP